LSEHLLAFNLFPIHHAAGPVALVHFVMMMSISYYMYTSGNLTGSPWGNLIAVFMVVGEHVLRTAFAVRTVTSPDNETNILLLSFDWLDHAMTSLVSVFSGVRGAMPKP
jgi:hypothetical protein